MQSFFDFIAEHQLVGSMVIGRANMPQIDDQSKFASWLAARGVEVKPTTLPNSQVKPVQVNFDANKVQSLIANKVTRTPIVCQNGYILDGHHGWLAQAETSDEIQVQMAMTSINQLMSMANEYIGELGEVSDG